MPMDEVATVGGDGNGGGGGQMVSSLAHRAVGSDVLWEGGKGPGGATLPPKEGRNTHGTLPSFIPTRTRALQLAVLCLH